jgi:hypothetical protein
MVWEPWPGPVVVRFPPRLAMASEKLHSSGADLRGAGRFFWHTDGGFT